MNGTLFCCLSLKIYSLKVDLAIREIPARDTMCP